MTLQFHLYFDGIEVAEPEIYRSEIEQYRRDSERSLQARHRRKYAWLKTIRNTVTQWTVALAVGSLFTHATFA